VLGEKFLMNVILFRKLASKVTFFARKMKEKWLENFYEKEGEKGPKFEIF